MKQHSKILNRLISEHTKNVFALMVVVVFFLSIQYGFAQQSPHGDIKIACSTCHSTDSWKMRSDATFDHASTGFALEGRHKSAPCSSCHEKFVFQKKNANCTSCHTDVHKSELGDNCKRCHSNDSWIIPDMKEKHQQTRLSLVGKHAFVPCESCHDRASTHRYAGTPIECIACHKKDFDATTQPNHTVVQFPVNCERCHSLTSSFATGFDHNQTAFPLSGAHQTVICSQCHTNNRFTAISTDCYSCHEAKFSSVQSPNHVSGGFSHQCVNCHTNTSWVPATFNHNGTNFPLTGAHTTVQCQSCHTNSNYNLVYSNCNQCHESNFQQATNPNHQTGNFSHECATCHTTTAWSPATFNHNGTNFPLTGAHNSVQCQSCHTNNNYTLTYSNCNQCHATDYQQATNPNHVAGNYSHDCTTCHSTTSWNTSTFNHNGTNFPLTGAHVSVQCQTCHANNNFTVVFSNCNQCHSAEFQQATNPNHVAQNFSHDCSTCHSTTVWTPSTFNHNGTNFPLTGAHIATQCQSCHTNGNYAITYSNCNQCHATDFQNATTPNHVTGNFSHNCTTCHTTTVWTPSTFNHNGTNFPLTGAHIATQCQSCHTNGNYTLTYSNCNQCHSTDFQNTTNPNHVAGNFSHDCSTCHSTTVWTPSTFSHNGTNFPLTGAHIATQCQSCHTNGNYALTYSNCNQCHSTDFQNATNPNHVNGNFSHDCSTCHSTTVWSPATFNHSATNFPLTGAHNTIECQQCHTNGNYTITYTNCAQCHQTDFLSALNPNHQTSAFSTVCQNCHTTTSWSPAGFNHNPTAFPLTGSHVAVQCTDCHTSGNYQVVYTNCYQCHQAKYQQVVSPNHVNNAFSLSCQSCHNTTVWTPSTFNHSSTAFALTGVHTTTPCNQCHTNDNYQLHYTNCYQCHQTKYAQPTNPNHVQANFDHNCATCHTTTVWTPSTLNHDTRYFKIKSGHHNGRWTLCTECHTTVTNYATFSCIDCHEHTQSSTNSHHTRVSGYSYVSSECYRCHRTTE